MGLDVVYALVILALTTLGGFFGSYLGEYFKTKGQNLATHEDIDKLVDQVRAVTTTAKEIEAKISDDVWDRQKRWEMKRDAIFDAAREIGLVQDALSQLYATYNTDKNSLAKGGPQRPEKRAEVYRAWNDAANRLETARLIIDLVCSDQMKKQLLKFILFTRDMSIEITEGRPEAFAKATQEYAANVKATIDALRNELGSPTQQGGATNNASAAKA